jgi:hypothetical protein
MRKRATKIALVLWAVASTALAVMTLARHELSLPVPEKRDRTFQAALDAEIGVPSSWQAIHFLYGPCRCSQRIVDHLVERGPRAPFDETIVVAADDGELGARLEKAGFPVTRTKADALRDAYHVESAPMLVVRAPTGEVVYAGGYTRTKQGLDVSDLAIFDDALARRRLETLPVAGCGVSRRLRTFLNPGEIL